MTKFLRGDRIWILAEVINDQHAEDFISCHAILASGNLDTAATIYADARKARIETPRVEPGMWINVGMMPYEVVARDGEYLWCRRQSGGEMATVHVSSVTSRREGPRSTEPAEPPPTFDPQDGSAAFNDNSKADWWPTVDNFKDGDKISRVLFSEAFPGASLTGGVGGWTMATPKGFWHLPAGQDTVWIYRDDIPF